jgi:hypothetical protein
VYKSYSRTEEEIRLRKIAALFMIAYPQDTVSWKFNKSCSVVCFSDSRGKPRVKSDIVVSIPAGITA